MVAARKITYNRYGVGSCNNTEKKKSLNIKLSQKNLENQQLNKAFVFLYPKSKERLN